MIEMEVKRMWIIQITLLTVGVRCLQALCPLPELTCKCETDAAGRNIINCAKKSLTVIPKITQSDILFDELNMEGNMITSLPDDGFNGLRIKKLNFGSGSSSNKLQRISEFAFRGLGTDLQELILNADQGSTITLPTAATRTLKNLRKLTLRNFRENYLTFEHFSEFGYLEYLDLDNVPVNTITTGTFANKPMLTTLKIRHSSLQSLPINMLQTMIGIESLSFQGGKISTVTSQAFRSLSRLRELDLSDNQLTQLESGSFDGLQTSLTHLNLMTNQLDNTHVQKIGNITTLQVLRLSLNRLTTFPGNRFPNIQIMHLDGNQIQNLQGISKSYSALQQLDLSNNYISRTDVGDFVNLSALKKLYFTDQKVQDLLIHSFEGLENTLEYLDLSQRHSQMTSLSDPFIWNAIKPLNKLKTLILDEANLKMIPDLQFEYTNQLEAISLVGNQIAQVTQDTFHGLKNTLQKIDLHGNLIQTIDRCAFKDFIILSSIQLNINPLHCDCRLLWLLDWYHEQSEIDPDFSIQNDWVCGSPQGVEQEPFSVMREHIAVCPEGVTQPNCKVYVSAVSGRLSNVSATYVNIQWTVAKTEYVKRLIVKYKQLPKGQFISTDVPSTSTYYRIDGLTEKVRYEVCLVAELSSNAVEESCFIAQTIVPPKLTLTVLSNYPLNTNIEWNVTDTEHISTFNIQYRQKQQLQQTASVSKEQMTFTMDDLKPNTLYEVCAKAVLMSGIDGVEARDCVDVTTSGYGLMLTTELVMRSPSYISVGWTVHGNHTVPSFNVRYKNLNDQEFTSISNISAALSEYKLDRLTADERYKICVGLQLSTKHKDENPETCIYRNTVLEPTLDVKVQSNNPLKFILKWINSHPYYIENYSVEYWGQSLDGTAENSSMIVDKDKGELLLPKLRPNTDYTLCVRGTMMSSIDLSDLKKCVHARTPAYNLSISTSLLNKSSNFVQIGWIASDITYIPSYVVKYKNMTSDSYISNNVTNTTQAYKFEDLVDGTQYEICVEIAFSPDYHPQECIIVITVIKPDVLLHVVSNYPRSFKILWDISNPNYIDSFVIEYHDLVGNTSEIIRNISNGQTQYILPELKPQTDYRMCITGVLLDTINVDDPQDCIFVETLDYKVEVDAKHVKSSTSCLDIAWTVTEGKINYFMVKYKEHETHPYKIIQNISNDTRQYTLDHLKPDTHYEVCVVGVMDLSYSHLDPISCFITFTMAVPKVNLEVNDENPANLTVNWEVSSHAHIMDYLLKYKVKGEKLSTEIIIPKGENHKRLSGLKGNTKYQICIYVVLKCGPELYFPNKTIFVTTTEDMGVQLKIVGNIPHKDLSWIVIAVIITGVISILMILLTMFYIVKSNKQRKNKAKTKDIQLGAFAAEPIYGYEVKRRYVKQYDSVYQPKNSEKASEDKENDAGINVPTVSVVSPQMLDSTLYNCFKFLEENQKKLSDVSSAMTTSITSNSSNFMRPLPTKPEEALANGTQGTYFFKSPHVYEEIENSIVKHGIVNQTFEHSPQNSPLNSVYNERPDVHDHSTVYHYDAVDVANQGPSFSYESEETRL